MWLCDQKIIETIDLVTFLCETWFSLLIGIRSVFRLSIAMYQTIPQTGSLKQYQYFIFSHRCNLGRTQQGQLAFALSRWLESWAGAIWRLLTYRCGGDVGCCPGRYKCFETKMSGAPQHFFLSLVVSPCGLSSMAVSE